VQIPQRTKLPMIFPSGFALLFLLAQLSVLPLLPTTPLLSTPSTHLSHLSLPHPSITTMARTLLVVVATMSLMMLALISHVDAQPYYTYINTTQVYNATTDGSSNNGFFFDVPRALLSSSLSIQASTAYDGKNLGAFMVRFFLRRWAPAGVDYDSATSLCGAATAVNASLNPNDCYYTDLLPQSNGLVLLPNVSLSLPRAGRYYLSVFTPSGAVQKNTLVSYSVQVSSTQCPDGLGGSACTTRTSLHSMQIPRVNSRETDPIAHSLDKHSRHGFDVRWLDRHVAQWNRGTGRVGVLLVRAHRHYDLRAHRLVLQHPARRGADRRHRLLHALRQHPVPQPAHGRRPSPLHRLGRQLDQSVGRYLRHWFLRRYQWHHVQLHCPKEQYVLVASLCLCLSRVSSFSASHKGIYVD